MAKISELAGSENLLGAMPSALMPRIFVNRAEVGDLGGGDSILETG